EVDDREAAGLEEAGDVDARVALDDLEVREAAGLAADGGLAGELLAPLEGDEAALGEAGAIAEGEASPAAADLELQGAALSEVGVPVGRGLEREQLGAGGLRVKGGTRHGRASLTWNPVCLKCPRRPGRPGLC